MGLFVCNLDDGLKESSRLIRYTITREQRQAFYTDVETALYAVKAGDVLTFPGDDIVPGSFNDATAAFVLETKLCDEGDISHLVAGYGLSLHPSDDAGKFDAIDEFHKAYMLRG